jgi:hypothetical protein
MSLEPEPDLLIIRYVRWLTPFLPIYGDEFIPLSVIKAVKEGNFRNDIKILSALKLADFT